MGDLEYSHKSYLIGRRTESRVERVLIIKPAKFTSPKIVSSPTEETSASNTLSALKTIATGVASPSLLGCMRFLDYKCYKSVRRF
jgi:hypothetical protein